MEILSNREWEKVDGNAKMQSKIGGNTEGDTKRQR